NTLNVPRVADALIDWMLAMPGNEDVRSVNPVVAETNDGQLNDIRGRHVRAEEVFAALKSAKGGEVEEGSVGAGTGTVAFGFKGGIGTASRVVPAKYGGYTVGVLVQTNFGGVLTMNGETAPRRFDILPNDSASPLFLACVEATEEAVYNSLLRATTVTGRNGTRVEALPIERTVEILKKYNAVRAVK